jgi:hypothetical protein
MNTLASATSSPLVPISMASTNAEEQPDPAPGNEGHSSPRDGLSE